MTWVCYLVGALVAAPGLHHIAQAMGLAGVLVLAAAWTTRYERQLG